MDFLETPFYRFFIWIILYWTSFFSCSVAAYRFFSTILLIFWDVLNLNLELLFQYSKFVFRTLYYLEIQGAQPFHPLFTVAIRKFSNPSPPKNLLSPSVPNLGVLFFVSTYGPRRLPYIQ